MKNLRNCPSDARSVHLKHYTTLRLGGKALMFRPATPTALIDLLYYFRQQRQNDHLLGNGSNLLANDADFSTPIIHTGLLNKIRFDSPYVEAEAGCLLPTLVRAVSKINLGGMEYLASVPGTVGGGVCMNAGRGMQFQCYLHQRVESVTCHDGARKWVVGGSALNSGFRWSIFRDDPSLCIISARFKLDVRPLVDIRRQIAERLRLARTREDRSGPNAGSVFRRSKDHSAYRGLRVGQAFFSHKTPNWIINKGATFREILALVRLVGRDDELEWVVWDE